MRPVLFSMQSTGRCAKYWGTPYKGDDSVARWGSLGVVGMKPKLKILDMSVAQLKDAVGNNTPQTAVGVKRLVDAYARARGYDYGTWFRLADLEMWGLAVRCLKPTRYCHFRWVLADGSLAPKRAPPPRRTRKF